MRSFLQTNLSVPIVMPNIDCAHCVLRVRYAPNKPTESVFHQCEPMEWQGRATCQPTAPPSPRVLEGADVAFQATAAPPATVGRVFAFARREGSTPTSASSSHELVELLPSGALQPAFSTPMNGPEFVEGAAVGRWRGQGSACGGNLRHVYHAWPCHLLGRPPAARPWRGELQPRDAARLLRHAHAGEPLRRNHAAPGRPPAAPAVDGDRSHPRLGARRLGCRRGRGGQCPDGGSAAAARPARPARRGRRDLHVPGGPRPPPTPRAAVAPLSAHPRRRASSTLRRARPALRLRRRTRRTPS